MNIGELFIALGFDVDDSKLKSFDDGIKSLTKDFAVVTGATTAALYGFEVFIDTAVRASVALYNFNQQTDLSTTSLQQWQAAATAANPALTVDQVTSSIAALENNLVEIRKFGGGNASPFLWLGIDISHGQTAIDILEELRAKVGQLDRATAVNLIQKMGLSPGFINVLTKSREEFDKFVAAQVRSKQSIDIIEKLAERMAFLQFKLSVFKDNLLADFTPGILQLIDVLEEFGKVAVQTLEDFWAAGEKLTGGHLMTWVAGLIALFNPLKALLTGLILIFEDLEAYRQGNTNTMIGKALGQPNINNLDPGDKLAFIKDLAGYNSDYATNPQGKYKSLLPEIPSSIHEDITKDFSRQGGEVNLNITNHINGAESPKSTSEAVVDGVAEYYEKIKQKDYNAGLADQKYKGAGF